MALLTPSHNAGRKFAARVVLAAVALFAGIAMLVQPAFGQKAGKDELKAAFVFQFANYVQWPEASFKDASDPIVIGIVNNTDMTKTLASAVRGKTVGARSVKVVDITSQADAATCHILYLDSSNDKQVSDYLAVVRSKPVLTVSDDDNFTSEGGVIRLFEKESKLRIEINIDEAARSSLTISSKLLSLAQVVNDKT